MLPKEFAQTSLYTWSGDSVTQPGPTHSTVTITKSTYITHFTNGVYYVLLLLPLSCIYFFLAACLAPCVNVFNTHHNVFLLLPVQYGASSTEVPLVEEIYYHATVGELSLNVIVCRCVLITICDRILDNGSKSHM